MPDLLDVAQNKKPVALLPPGLDLPFAAHGPGAPAEPPPEPAIPPPAPRKRPNKSLVLAILLFLLGTLPLAVYFTSQQRQLADTRSKAQQGPYPASCGGNGQTCCDPFSSGGKICDGSLYCNTASGKCESSKPANLCQGLQGSGGQAGDLCEVFICQGKCDAGNQCTKSAGKVPCSQATLGGQCGQIDWLDTNGAYCGVKEQNCGGPCAGGQAPGPTSPPAQQTSTPPPPPPATPSPTPAPTATPSPTPAPTATPSPTPTPPAAQCRNIKIYKGSNVVLPSTLQPGDQVTIAIVGANATKARARVNGGTWTETTTTNSSGEYTVQFTVPASGGTFTIEAEVYQNGVWQ